MHELPFDADVICTDGQGGTSVAFTLHPMSRKITHLVVEDGDGRQRLVSLQLIEKTDHEKIWLNCTEDELKEKTLFQVTEFVERAAQQSGDWSDDEDGEWEDGIDVSQFERTDEAFGMPVVVEKVPPGEVAFHRGTDIEATDDHVGVVERFLVEDAGGQITHLVMHKGHLWGKKDIMIPLSAVESMDYDSVYLSVDKETAENYPEQPK